MGAYHRPEDLDTALRLLAAGPVVPLAGGTDLFPADAARSAWGEPALDTPEGSDLVDLSGLNELCRVEDLADRVEIGARVTWTDALHAPLPPWFDAIRQAAREVGGMQIQNRGTLVGNLCNASPAADGVPPLMALDARVRLASLRGTRELPLDRFLLGNRRTARAPDELVTHIVLPKPPAAARSVFLKLGARRYLVISIAMVAMTVVLDGSGRIAGLRVAVGACSPVAVRLVELEKRLRGLTPDAAAAAVEPADLAMLAPIDDVRASGAYRRHAALVLLRRALGGERLQVAA
ncbi:MAG: xanthine dehydrogenase family protein subunit M [Geminicoccaceae bacterium]